MCLIVCIYDYVTMFICLHMGRVHIARVNNQACTQTHDMCTAEYIYTFMCIVCMSAMCVCMCAYVCVKCVCVFLCICVCN